MKKVLITVALISAYTFVNAQDEATASTPSTNSTSEFKPAAGANNFELNFVPLNGKPIQLTYIRYRRFLSESTALRLGVGLSLSSTSVDSVFSSNVTAGENVTSKAKTSQFGWNLKPGFEKHFSGTNRLSPYIGAELDLAGQSSKEVTPTGISATDEVMTTTTKNKSKGGFFRAGVNLVAGFDCYITKHLYLGSEFGFGLQYVSYSKLKTEMDPAPTAPAKQPDDVDQGSEMNIGPNFNSAIRLGFIF